MLFRSFFPPKMCETFISSILLMEPSSATLHVMKTTGVIVKDIQSNSVSKMYDMIELSSYFYSRWQLWLHPILIQSFSIHKSFPNLRWSKIDFPQDASYWYNKTIHENAIVSLLQRAERSASNNIFIDTIGFVAGESLLSFIGEIMLLV